MSLRTAGSSSTTKLRKRAGTPSRGPAVSLTRPIGSSEGSNASRTTSNSAIVTAPTSTFARTRGCAESVEGPYGRLLSGSRRIAIRAIPTAPRGRLRRRPRAPAGVPAGVRSGGNPQRRRHRYTAFSHGSWRVSTGRPESLRRRTAARPGRQASRCHIEPGHSAGPESLSVAVEDFRNEQAAVISTYPSGFYDLFQSAQRRRRDEPRRDLSG